MTSFLRIAMIAPFGIRPKGTLSARMLPLAQALVQRGHHVLITAPPVNNPLDAGRRDEYGGVTVLHTQLSTLPEPLATVQQVRSLWREALAFQPDVLHLFKPKGYGGLAALIAQATHPGVPLVVDTDDWEGWGGWNDLLPYPRSAKQLFAWQERNLPRRAAAVTVASRTLESQVWGFGVPPAHVFYLPNGVALDNVPQRNDDGDRKTLLLYTRFWEFDLPALVAALVGIHTQRPTARLVVVGKGERGEEEALLRLARRAGIAAMLDYRGWLEPQAIPALLATATLALVPLSDTLINRARCSAKLLELMAAGLPVIAGDVGQTSAYIERGVSGLLVAPDDPAALARATLTLLGDGALQQRLGAAAHERVGQFTWARLAPTAEQAYWTALR